MLQKDLIHLILKSIFKFQKFQKFENENNFPEIMRFCFSAFWRISWKFFCPLTLEVIDDKESPDTFPK